VSANIDALSGLMFAKALWIWPAGAISRSAGADQVAQQRHLRDAAGFERVA
jgi:hypothetical protein